MCDHIKLKMKVFFIRQDQLNNINITSFSKTGWLFVHLNVNIKWRTVLVTSTASKETQLILQLTILSIAK